MIRLRYLPDSIIARKVSATEFSHSLDPERLFAVSEMGKPGLNRQIGPQNPEIARALDSTL